ncbi:MAG: TIR domain-containing protein [Halanaerobiales bacterium]|nr:TIR domain-containing protein [Halanaerobiales bacterium]
MSKHKFIDEYDYDIAVSFAGEDRDLVVEFVKKLRDNDVRVFYDKSEQANLWGKNLYQYLSDLYYSKAKYCIIFISEKYIEKRWTKLELNSAQTREFEQNQEYILPILLDQATVPGILSTKEYIDIKENSIDEIVLLMLEKLNKSIVKNDNEIINNIEPSLLKHIMNEIEYYRKNDITIYTPQILLILLTYRGSVLKRVLNEINTAFGEYLCDVFKRENERYKSLNLKFDTNLNLNKLLGLNEAEFFREKEGRPYITENLISYSVLNKKSRTIDQLVKRLGDKQFKEIKEEIKENRTPFNESW